MGASEGNGPDGELGSAAAGGGDTGDATSAAADEAGAESHHGARAASRERVTGRQENTAGDTYGVGGGGEDRKAYRVASEPSGVGGDGGVREAYGVAENPRGDRQGLGVGVQLPQGIDTPEVDALTRGDKIPGVDTEGDGVTEEDWRGRGGDGTPSTTRASAESGSDGGNNGMSRGPRTAAPPCPSGMEADDNSV